jgi:hypothetical protein
LQGFGAEIVARAPFSLGAPKPEPKPAVQPIQEAALTGQLINPSAIGEQLGISQQRVNLLLAELGWIEREEDGWRPTERGLALGAVRRVYPMSGAVFTIWPDSVVRHMAVVRAMQSAAGEATQAQQVGQDSVRERLPAQHRATDGHMVRSKAEVLIDNWLYMAGIVHAYERQLPIEEDACCGFYIPQGQLYIEHWEQGQEGAERDRRRATRGLYQRYRFNLLELTDEHISDLDGVMPRLLLKFGVSVM